MELSVQRDDPTLPAVMRVAGEVDVLTSTALRDALTRHIGAGRPDLIVDLSGVTFLDSSGLSVLVRAERQVRERGGRMDLVVAQERVVDLLRITALEQMFRIHRTLEEAWTSLVDDA